MLKSVLPAVTLILFGFSACTDKVSSKNGSDDRSSEIIDQAIQAMGGDILDQAEITFDFRDQTLSYYADKGNYRYTRVFTDKAGQIVTDTLTNHDFIRYTDGKRLDLSDERKSTLQGGVNSIIYFAFLPFKLNDPSAINEYVSRVAIQGKTYEKIKVSFHNEQGNAAHNDVYYYYFDPEDLSLDYFAYKFQEDGGGIRFRSGYNERSVDGLTIRDYINYMADPDSVEFSTIEKFYNQDQLQELSRIELRNVEVKDL